MQNSCCCLRSLTANALKTSEMSCQCLNMAPTARVAGASATPQQRLVALATRALATWVQNSINLLKHGHMQTAHPHTHTHSYMYMWVSYQFHVQSTWQTGLTHRPLPPPFRVEQDHQHLLKARCTAMAQNPGPLKQMSAWFLHMRQRRELRVYIYGYTGITMAIAPRHPIEKPWRDFEGSRPAAAGSCMSCPAC